MVLSPQETKHDSVSVGTVIVRIALLGVVSYIYIHINSFTHNVRE